MTCPSSKHSDQVDQPRKASRYWRSLSELQQSPDFDRYLNREFPVAASEFPKGVTRRRWLQLMSASLAMAGAAGCRYPEELIAPFVLRPEGRVPGESYERATNFELAGRVYNLLVSCVDGRPLKIEPNTLHPSGVGTDVYSQASVLSLYDPDRSRSDDGPILKRGEKGRREAVAWDEFVQYSQLLMRTAAADGRGVKTAILMPPTHSPSVVRMLVQVRQQLPEAMIVVQDGVTAGVMAQATKSVFGTAGRQVLNLADAKVVVSLQADILGNDSGFLKNAAGFAKQRNPLTGDISRLYVVEGGYTSTGASADARLALRPSQMPAFLAELDRRIDAIGQGQPAEQGEPESAYDELGHAERLERFIDSVATDLAAAKGAAVVVVGEHLGPEAVAAGIRLNQKLGSLGTLQRFSPLITQPLGETQTLTDLAAKVSAGDIDTLLILDGNPVFTSPGNIDVAALIGKVEHTVYLGEYDDETAVLCDWSVPIAHPLESWGDVVNDEGHYGVCQPQILPLLGGRELPEILALMLSLPDTSAEQIVRQTAETVGEGGMSNRQWRQLLHDGFAEGMIWDTAEFSVSGAAPAVIATPPVADGEISQDAIEVLFMPADGLYDGRFANNGWLQELPQALTKLTWDNSAVMSPATAKTLQVSHGTQIALRRGDAIVTLPVYEMPGCAPGVVSTTIGYGRTRAGMVGGLVEDDVDSVGVDVSPIRFADSMLVAYNVEARPRYTDYELATTQDHWAIDELGKQETESRSYTLIREGTTLLLDKLPEFAEAKAPHVPKVGPAGSLWEEPINEIQEARPKVPQWAMAIDLSKCIGCSACVIACQSENNVPIVGREQVLNSREMHWLRIDRYFQGNEEHADIVQEPVACMHCETAPCEQVCPVAATVHTDEGINAMAYNRCIGTRYCANNCPFKVRRFNYFNYNKEIGVGYGIDAYPDSIEAANRKLQSLVMNPEVTVRGRGVMEKCTYCTQRVEHAKIQARKEGGRPIVDGDVVTACQSACPTQAIQFGNLSDPQSQVNQWHADVRSYGMLPQLNLKTRTKYLARIRNTPMPLMTRAQLNDLAFLQAPHHAHEGDHHGEEHHGEEHHGEEHHGEEHHDETHSAAAADH